MAKSNLETIETAVNSDFEVAKEALEGAKAADELANSDLDETTKQKILALKKRFLVLSTTASSNATVISTLASFIPKRSET